MANTRIFMTIAVHDPQGGLPALPGALESAKRIGKWAKSHDYELIAVDDSDKNAPVTVSVLRKLLGDKISDIVDNQSRMIDRIVIYFAGHGLGKTNLSSYWLLSEWSLDPSEAVNVTALQRILRYYNPVQVSLIGDACRDLDEASIDILGSAILRRPKDEEPALIEIDQFFASEAGTKAYMMPSEDGKKAFCVFSEVLLDGLEGEADSALDTEIKSLTRVTSQSLNNYLRKDLPTIADGFGVTMKADPVSGFFTDRVYSEFAEAEATFTPSSGGTPAKRTSRKPAKSKPASRRKTKKIRFKPIQTDADLQQDMQLKTEKRNAQISDAETSQLEWSRGEAPHHFESGCGFTVSGSKVKEAIRLYGGRVEELEPSELYRVWNFRETDQGYVDTHFSDIAITFDTGQTAYLCAIQDFTSALALDHKGSSSVIYKRNNSHAAKERTLEILDVISKLDSGLLSFSDAASTAAKVRHEKHIDLTLGCIAAYLYDSIGDIEGVRKTASYYPYYGQPLPLDIALLSGGQIRMNPDGTLRVDIPATPDRKPRTETEEQYRYTYRATNARNDVPVAGLVPWMRGGWLAAETAYVHISADYWRDGIRDLAGSVTSSPLSVLKPGAVKPLANLLGENLYMRSYF